MKLGLLTASLPQLSLESIAEWASGQGLQALEVAAWPSIGDRPFTASHLAVDRFDSTEADRVNELFTQHELTLSSVAYYDNNLHPDQDERKAVNEHVAA